MAIPVQFNKARSANVLECLKSGLPITPEESNWTGNDLLAVAGACLFAAMSHGPGSWANREIPETMHPEYAEALSYSFQNGLHGAIEFYCQLASLVADDKFDQHYEDKVLALADMGGDIKWKASVVTGEKE